MDDPSSGSESDEDNQTYSIDLGAGGFNFEVPPESFIAEEDILPDIDEAECEPMIVSVELSNKERLEVCPRASATAKMGVGVEGRSMGDMSLGPMVAPTIVELSDNTRQDQSPTTTTTTSGVSNSRPVRGQLPPERLKVNVQEESLPLGTQIQSRQNAVSPFPSVNGSTRQREARVSRSEGGAGGVVNEQQGQASGPEIMHVTQEQFSSVTELLIADSAAPTSEVSDKVVAPGNSGVADMEVGVSGVESGSTGVASGEGQNGSPSIPDQSTKMDSVLGRPKQECTGRPKQVSSPSGQPKQERSGRPKQESIDDVPSARPTDDVPSARPTDDVPSARQESTDDVPSGRPTDDVPSARQESTDDVPSGRQESTDDVPSSQPKQESTDEVSSGRPTGDVPSGQLKQESTDDAPSSRPKQDETSVNIKSPEADSSTANVIQPVPSVLSPPPSPPLQPAEETKEPGDSGTVKQQSTLVTETADTAGPPGGQVPGGSPQGTGGSMDQTGAKEIRTADNPVSVTLKSAEFQSPRHSPYHPSAGSLFIPEEDHYHPHHLLLQSPAPSLDDTSSMRVEPPSPRSETSTMDLPSFQDATPMDGQAMPFGMGEADSSGVPEIPMETGDNPKDAECLGSEASSEVSSLTEVSSLAPPSDDVSTSKEGVSLCEETKSAESASLTRGRVVSSSSLPSIQEEADSILPTSADRGEEEPMEVEGSSVHVGEGGVVTPEVAAPCQDADLTSQPTDFPSQDNMASQDTSQDDVVSQDMSQDTVVSQDTSQDTVVSQNTSQDTVVSQDTSQDPVVSQDMSQNTMVSQDTSQDTVVSQDMSQNTVVSQDTSQDTVVSQDTSQDTVVSQDTTPPQDMSQDNTVSQGASQDNIAYQETSQDNTASQDASQDIAASQDTAQVECERPSDQGIAADLAMTPSPSKSPSPPVAPPTVRSPSPTVVDAPTGPSPTVVDTPSLNTPTDPICTPIVSVPTTSDGDTPTDPSPTVVDTPTGLSPTVVDAPTGPSLNTPTDPTFTPNEDTPTGPSPSDVKPPTGPSPIDGDTPTGPSPSDVKSPTGPSPIDGDTPTGPSPSDVKPPTGPSPIDRDTPTGPSPSDVKPPTGPSPIDGDTPTDPSPTDVDTPTSGAEVSAAGLDSGQIEVDLLVHAEAEDLSVFSSEAAEADQLHEALGSSSRKASSKHNSNTSGSLGGGARQASQCSHGNASSASHRSPPPPSSAAKDSKKQRDEKQEVSFC